MAVVADHRGVIGRLFISLFQRASAMTEESASSPASSESANSYWRESSSPLASLAFVTPLLVVYEAGVLLWPNARNGADAWMRQFLELLGSGQYFLLPVLTVGILLAWHHTRRDSWRLSRGILGGMAAECAVLSVCLWVIAELQSVLLYTVGEPICLSLPDVGAGVVRYLGAGIYEELLFRLILLSAVGWALRRMDMKPGSRMVLAVLATSVIFSAAHYVGPHGYVFTWYTFFFRFIAGMFFGVLFVSRGFGIAAGAHAGYDILAGMIAWPFG